MKYYDLGVMDLYPMAVSGTEIEDSPTLEIQLDENIDGKRLEEAVLYALFDIVSLGSSNASFFVAGKEAGMSKKKSVEEIKIKQEKVEQRIHFLENEEKRLESSLPTLTRKARTHRLCTRGGMLEGFLGKPGEISDEQVYELLKIAFRQDEVKDALSSILPSTPEVDLEEEPGLPYGSP